LRYGCKRVCNYLHLEGYRFEKWTSAELSWSNAKIVTTRLQVCGFELRARYQSIEPNITKLLVGCDL
jgi:hypothetical protein